MGEAHLGHIAHQFIGKFEIAEWSVPIFGLAPPGTEMHFIHGHGRGIGITFRSPLHPIIITPVVMTEIGHHASGAKIVLGIEGIGIGFQEYPPVLSPDFEFIMIPLPHPRHEDLPDTGAAESPHHVPATIPFVKIPHHAHALSIRRPDCERRALDFLHLAGMGTHHPMGLKMIPLPEKIEVKVTQLGGKGVSIPAGVGGSVREGRDNPVRKW